MSHTFFSVLKLNFQERLSSMLQEVQEYTKLCHEDSEKELAEQQKIVEKYKRKWHFLRCDFICASNQMVLKGNSSEFMLYF